MPGLLGKKIGMTSVFSADGKNLPCTVIEVGPCVVTQLKTVEKDGYAAVQVGFQEAKEKNTSKPMKGHFAKAGTTPKRHLAEFTFDEEHNLGDVITVELFNDAAYVDVVGTSKGKGFQGVIKRWNQSRGPETHGSTYHRRVGSLGTMRPMRVLKGKKLPGHMGNEQITIQNLMIVDVDTENKYILVSGNVPGAKNSFVFIREAIKGSKYSEGVELISYEDVQTVEESPANEVVNNEAVVEDNTVETPDEVEKTEETTSEEVSE